MILHIKAVGAVDLPKMDVFGKADPYMVFTYSKSKEKYKTSYRKKTYTPIWNEEFHIPVEKDCDSFIHADLIDWDPLPKHDLISTHDFPIDSFKVGQVIDEWYEFESAHKVSKPGRVHLIFHLAFPNQKPFESLKKSFYKLPIKFCPTQFNSLEEAFREIDEDQNGCIDLSETEDFLQKIGFNQSFAPLAFEICGKDINSTISFEEFHPFYKLLNNINKDKRCIYRILFDKFDTDHNGFLDKKEIFQFLSYFGGNDWKEDEVNNFIDSHDDNHDGKLSFDELCDSLNDELASQS